VFAEAVRLEKLGVAWSIVPRQYERAMLNSTTDAIWLQKVLGGAEFNPDRQALTINTHAPTMISFQLPDPPSPTLPLRVNSDESPTETC